MSRPSDRHALHRTFQKSLYPDEDEMNLPKEFVSYWRGKIKPGDVLIADPKDTLFDVHLHLGTNDFGIFDFGVRSITNNYGIKEEHTTTFKYMGKNCFEIRVFTMDGEEIDYPLVNDQREEENGEDVLEEVIIISSDEEDHTTNDEPKDPRFHYYFEKHLTEKQVNGTKLLLGAHFCSVAIPRGITSFLLEDERTKKYSCSLSWTLRRKNECYWTSGWEEFCNSKDLKEGDVLRIGVPRHYNGIYVKIVV